jgi:hypothetical protein
VTTHARANCSEWQRRTTPAFSAIEIATIDIIPDMVEGQVPDCLVHQPPRTSAIGTSACRTIFALGSDD